MFDAVGSNRRCGNGGGGAIQPSPRMVAGVPIFVEHWGGDNLQFYPNFALFSTLGGMNLNHDIVQVSKLSEDQKKVFTKNGILFLLKFRWRLKKKRSSPEMEHFFPQTQVDTYAQMHTRV